MHEYMFHLLKYFFPFCYGVDTAPGATLNVFYNHTCIVMIVLFTLVNFMCFEYVFCSKHRL